MGFGSIAALFATMALLSAAPGPIDFAVAARAAGEGLRAAMIMVLGILLADTLFLLAAVYGLAAVARDMEQLFDIILWLSAGFLFWLGISTFRKGRGRPDGETPEPSVGSDFSSFIAGLLLTLGDPKAILFYMALLPAFLDPAAATVRDVIAVLCAAVLAVGLVKFGYAYSAIRLSRALTTRAGSVTLHRAAGVVLVVAALILLVRQVARL